METTTTSFNQLIIRLLNLILCLNGMALMAQNNPTFTSTPSTIINRGEFYFYKIETTDADGDRVTVSAPTLPNWLDFNDANQVSTLAGSSQGYANGTGTAAQFHFPRGVATDAIGNTYVADSQNHRIRKIDKNGVVTLLAGSFNQGFGDGTGANAMFSNPTGIAVDISGNVFVIDFGNKIRKITPNGRVTTLFLTTAAGTFVQFNNARGLALDTSGNIYVADTGNHAIRKITPNGIVTTFAGTLGNPGFFNGTLGRFSLPTGIAFDNAGNLYVADRGNHRIAKITPDGITSTVAGFDQGFGNGTGNQVSFDSPWGLTVDTSGNIYVADNGNNRIRKITPTGTVTTFAGNGTIGSTNGDLNTALFSNVGDIAIDPVGNLFITDSHRIRKITTFANLLGDSSGLSPGLYPVSLQASDGNVGFANQSFSIMLQDTPTATSTEATNITTNSAQLNGEITGSGGALISERGFIYALSSNDPSPTLTEVDGNTVIKVPIGGTEGVISQVISNLVANSRYSYRSYATNDAGSAESNISTFSTTNTPPTFTSTPVTAINTGDSYNYAITTNDLDNDAIVITAPTLPSWLNLSTQNQVRILSGNSSGQNGDYDVVLQASDGNGGIVQQPFTITVTGVVIQTAAATNVTLGTAQLNAEVSADGGATITERGFVYALDADDTTPTVAEVNDTTVFKVQVAGTTGSYSEVISNLVANQRYRYIAYAIGNTGTTEGNVRSFTTNTPPTFTSTPITSINAGDQYIYTITTNDIEGELVNVSAPTLPSWINFDQRANVTSILGTFVGITVPGTIPGLDLPQDVTIDASENIYITDTEYHRIVKITADGVVSNFAGVPDIPAFANSTLLASGFNRPTGIAIDGFGNIYVAERSSHRIRKIIPNEDRVITFAGGPGFPNGFVDGTGSEARFLNPEGLASDASGTLYVADTGNHSIRKITPDGVVTTLAGNGVAGFANGIGVEAQFNFPTDVAVDLSGNVYVADRNNFRIRKITPDGEVTTLAGSATFGFADGLGNAARFTNPSGVAVNASGTVYVADRNNFRIREISPSGEVTTLAGNQNRNATDGIGILARFDEPQGIAVSPSGRTVFVADTGNRLIRKIPTTTRLLGDSTGQAGDYDVALQATDPSQGNAQQAFTITVTATSELTNVLPANNSVAVANNASIDFTFSSPVSANLVNTTNIVIAGNQTGPIAGTFSGQDTTTITFTPDNNYKAGEIISMSVTNGIVSNPTVSRFTVPVSPDSPALFPYNERVISTNVDDGVRDVESADLDGDGDLDILSASQNDDRIAWYKNDGAGNFSARQTITTSANGAFSVSTADIDGDGDLDVLSASLSDDKIAWYENDGAGNFSAQQTITTSANGANSVSTADIDGDGDIDVLSASGNDDKIAWYQNDGSGNFGTQQTISTDLDFAVDVTVADLDGDGDLDVLSASSGDDKIAWYENDGAGNFSAQQTITTSANGANSVSTADLDGDGDIDVLSASRNDDKIAWYQNDGAGNFGTQQTISTDLDFAFDVTVADLDGDGDVDVLSASINDHKIALYENDGSGNFGLQQIITTNAVGARNVTTADLDGDGDVDVISASSRDDKIAWYPNTIRQLLINSTPQNNAIAVANDTAILLNFNEPVLADVINTSNIVITGRQSAPISGSFTGQGSSTITFTTDTNFKPGEIISISLTDNIVGRPTVLRFTAGVGADSSAEFTNGQTIITSDADGPRDVKSADMDGDGHLDVLSASSTDNSIFWYKNYGLGNLGTQQIVSTVANNVRGISTADLDNDGDLDVLAANSNRFVWYENEGMDTFSVARNITTTDANGANSITAADIDGDGDLDAITAATNSDRIAWFPNDGSGNFGAEQIINATADGANSVTTADLDGDGDMDVVSSLAGNRRFIWCKNDGIGNFTTQVINTVFTYSPTDVTVADLDGDGDIDIVASTAGIGGGVLWFTNDGAGNFTTQPNIATGNPTRISTADLDGDGDLDVISASSFSDSIDWYENQGSGSFGVLQNITRSVDAITNIDTADLDADGDLDILSASFSDNKIAWYENVGTTLSTSNTIEEAGFTLFPNPVTDVLNIKSRHTIDKVEVLDITGRLVKTATFTNTSELTITAFSNLNTGTYLIKIITKNGIIIRKIIKD